MKQLAIISLMLNLLFSQVVYAQTDIEEYTKESQALLKALEQKIIGTLLAVASNEKRLGKDMANFHYSLSIPEQYYVEFGLVLDFRDYKKGFKVVSVIPNSVADKAGIKVADIIVNINGVIVSKLQSKPDIASLWNISATDTLHLGINTAGIYREVTSAVPKVYLPEVSLEIKGREVLSTSLADLKLVYSSNSVFYYEKEGLNFTDYRKIQIMPSKVQFKKSWLKKYNRKQNKFSRSSRRISDKDLLKTKMDIANAFDDNFIKEFNDLENYKLVQQVVANTLLIKPYIVNLDLGKPQMKSGLTVKQFSNSSGQATLFLEIYDGISGELLARYIDSKNVQSYMHYELTNEQSNAKRMFRSWSKNLISMFEKQPIK